MSTSRFGCHLELEVEIWSSDVQIWILVSYFLSGHETARDVGYHGLPWGSSGPLFLGLILALALVFLLQYSVGQHRSNMPSSRRPKLGENRFKINVYLDDILESFFI